ncbi:hypothetical protein ISN44_As11g026800, partial [Arabidopsis suecica]
TMCRTVSTGYVRSFLSLLARFDLFSISVFFHRFLCLSSKFSVFPQLLEESYLRHSYLLLLKTHEQRWILGYINLGVTGGEASPELVLSGEF